jgi:hypothetical protein
MGTADFPFGLYPMTDHKTVAMRATRGQGMNVMRSRPSQTAKALYIGEHTMRLPLTFASAIVGLAVMCQATFAQTAATARCPVGYQPVAGVCENLSSGDVVLPK